jgi:Regulator of chromosome condensation (RCC1) repeat
VDLPILYLLLCRRRSDETDVASQGHNNLGDALPKSLELIHSFSSQQGHLRSHHVHSQSHQALHDGSIVHQTIAHGRRLLSTLQYYSSTAILRQKALQERARLAPVHRPLAGQTSERGYRPIGLTTATAQVPAPAPMQAQPAPDVAKASSTTLEITTDSRVGSPEVPSSAGSSDAASGSCTVRHLCGETAEAVTPICTAAGAAAIPGQLLSIAKDSNRLSLGRKEGSTGLPIPVDSTPVDVSVVAAGGHNIVIDKAGTLWTWGRNNSAGGGGYGSESIPASGQLGGSRLPGTEQEPAVVQSDERFMAAGSGRYHSAAVSKSGKLFTWGLNDFGQLGRPADDSSNMACSGGATCHSAALQPAVSSAEGFEDERFVAVAAGRYHTVAAAKSGAVYTSGLNFCGNGQVRRCTYQLRISARDFPCLAKVPCCTCLSSYHMQLPLARRKPWTTFAETRRSHARQAAAQLLLLSQHDTHPRLRRRGPRRGALRRLHAVGCADGERQGVCVRHGL